MEVFRGGGVRLRVLVEEGWMAAKKMFPPRAVENLLGDDYDEFKLEISFRIQAGQVVMQFSDHLWKRPTTLIGYEARGSHADARARRAYNVPSGHSDSGHLRRTHLRACPDCPELSRLKTKGLAFR